MKLWIDADASPKVVKEIVFNLAIKRNLQLVLVANKQMHIPLSPLISLVVVGKNLDEADRYILENCTINDLVITADIPLASALVDKGLIVLNPRGSVYDKENVKEALSMRNLLQDLRDSGMIQSGPPPFGAKEKIAFTNALDREITKLLKRSHDKR